MPLQNRVTPFGTLEAVAARGAWTGNRGILHDEHQRIVVQWRSKAWITCRLQFKGVHRAVFSPHTWSELFFLDEATAFAAGHRPCACCRRERYVEFKNAWCAANRPLIGRPNPRVQRIDAILHRQRLTPDGGKRTWRARLSELPDGAFVVVDGNACLRWHGRVLPWSHRGYGAALHGVDAHALVEVLTPRSIVATFAIGLVPQVHLSASAGCGVRRAASQRPPGLA
ncbi:MAG TPA: hypothetical protein VF265_08415 [Nevskiaceae bacterium]